MTIKCVLAAVPEISETVSPAIAAIDIARQFGGYAECLLLHDTSVDAANPVPVVSYAGNPDTIVAAQEAAARLARERERRRDSMCGTVRQICDSRGVDFYERDVVPPAGTAARLPMVSLRLSNGRGGNEAVRRAQAFDLVVTLAPGSVEGQPVFQQVAETTLMESGRPILMVPSVLPESIGRHVAIAWEPSVPAWHAVSCAMPFLESAARVTVVTVDHGRQNGDAQADLLAYLARHGIDADARHETAAGSIGDTLLSFAYDEEVDLMAMGGYSHSRLRELLLGGTTRHILRHAAATSVLMAH